MTDHDHDHDHDHDVWLQDARSLLAVARRDPGTLEQSLHYLCKRAFRDFQFPPSVILDYMVVSSPGLFEEAGFSEAEIDGLMPTIDRVVGQEWVARGGDAKTVVRIAREILEGSTPVFLGCKQLVGPLNRLGVHREEPFVTISGVESELDESPVWPDERKLWSAQALAREDAKLAAWLPRVRPAVLEACRAILRRFGDNDRP